MNRHARGFTLMESLIALLLLSVGLLGAGVLLFEALRAHADAIRDNTATLLVRDMVERIRANPQARALYAASEVVGAADCEAAVACDPGQRAAADVAHYRSAVRAVFPGADTSAFIEFEPAIGPAAPDRYRISLRWRGPHDDPGAPRVVTLTLLARPVAGEA